MENTGLNVNNIVCKCLENIGVIIETNNSSEEDINLVEYGIDSLAFISFVVDVEQQLDIVIPEELLHTDILESLNGFVSLLAQVVEDNKIENIKSADG